ncbi:MAG: NAD(P)-dependent oxidoreductase [Propionibacteriaceae bacterium]|jgi:nucleoside-diphosphate-sugar epimerase|nr:NAD(P)-dependent oxidoreductase [Propionibacteriaceae bacterium]
MTQVLVTGGSGALASYVIPRLAAAGFQSTAFDVAPPTRLDEAVPFIQGDLTSLGDCLRAMSYARPEVIVHLGAIPSPREMKPGWFRTRQIAPEDLTMRANVMGTYCLMEAATKIGGVKQVVFASSYYVLGLGFRISDRPFDVRYLPLDEEHPLEPEDSYSVSKLLGEEILKSYQRAYGIRVVALRLMGVDYPFRNPDHYGETPVSQPGHVGGPVGTTFQYVDARDAADAVVLAIEAKGLEAFEAFHISTDTIYDEDTKSVVARVWPDLAPLAEGFVGAEGVISDAKARAKLGYQPHYSWRDQK